MIGLSKEVIQDVLIESTLNIQNWTQHWDSASDTDPDPGAKYTGAALLVTNGAHMHS